MYYRVDIYLGVDAQGDREKKKPPSPRCRKTPLPRKDRRNVRRDACTHCSTHTSYLYIIIPVSNRLSPFLLYLSKNTKLTAADPHSHSIPTYLNHSGRQSSRFNHFSPSVKRPVTQPEHFGLFGQLKKGMCWYPISRNQWILFLSSNRPSATLWTGASPQRS